MATITQLVKGKTAVFVEYHSENMFYEIEGENFRFPVPVKELQGTSVKAKERASVFMRWIKRALKQIEAGDVE